MARFGFVSRVEVRLSSRSVAGTEKHRRSDHEIALEPRSRDRPASIARHRRADVPIRIYALAKDLKIDSKELVEFCNKAGIPGKGSALASLEDDEVSKLKAWMDASAAKRQAT